MDDSEHLPDATETVCRNARDYSAKLNNLQQKETQEAGLQTSHPDSNHVKESTMGVHTPTTSHLIMQAP